MVFHPPGIVVAIAGTEVGDHRAARAKSTPLTAARCWSQMYRLVLARNLCLNYYL